MVTEETAIVEEIPNLRPSPSPMPPEVAKGIIKVMAGVKLLGKDATNPFQRYKYTSVDQFYEAIGPLMADAGIFTLLMENSIDISKQETTNDRGETKSSMWMSVSYDIYIYHETGVSFGPVQRSIRVLANGAQAYAAATSFVEKYYLRQLFKIPTGEADANVDLDMQDKHILPASDGRRQPPPPPAQRQVPTTPVVAVAKPFDFNAYRAALEALETKDQVESLYKRGIEDRVPPLNPDDLEECKAILREVVAKFYQPEPDSVGVAVLTDQPESGGGDESPAAQTAASTEFSSFPVDAADAAFIARAEEDVARARDDRIVTLRRLGMARAAMGKDALKAWVIGLSDESKALMTPDMQKEWGNLANRGLTK